MFGVFFLSGPCAISCCPQVCPLLLRVFVKQGKHHKYVHYNSSKNAGKVTCLFAGDKIRRYNKFHRTMHADIHTCFFRLCDVSHRAKLDLFCKFSTAVQPRSDFGFSRGIFFLIFFVESPFPPTPFQIFFTLNWL